MRSAFVDQFNHDEDAEEYDSDVLNEADPIRTGYQAVLDWVVAKSAIGTDSKVLELGSGTGNLTERLPPCARLLCVDISVEMTRIARQKLGAGRPIEFLCADLLEVFGDSMLTQAAPLDCVLSTYAVHHLTANEKSILFEKIRSVLRPEGRVVIGDLMFADGEDKARILASYRQRGDSDLALEIEEEFFWTLDEDRRALEALGFVVEARRFSELSWGIAASLSTDS